MLPGFWGFVVFRHVFIPRKGSGNNNGSFRPTQYAVNRVQEIPSRIAEPQALEPPLTSARAAGVSARFSNMMMFAVDEKVRLSFYLL